MADIEETPILKYFIKNLELLHWRDYLQELLTIPDRHVCTWDDKAKSYVLETEAPLYVGKLVQLDDLLMRIEVFEKAATNIFHLKLTPTGIVSTTDGPLLKPNTPVVLPPGVVENYPEGPPLETTIGRVILNYMVLAEPFGNAVPYINKLWDPGSLEKIIGDLVIRKEVSVEQVNTYITNLYFLGHAPELIVPNLSEKSLVTDPNIAIRKRELLEEHKEALAAGDAVVMSQIEQELIAMDKAYLKGDSSMGYYIKGAAFSVQRKKLLLTHGMVEAFGDVGNYDFIANSLEEGWTVDNFPKIANEIRAGSYSRAKEVAKGGEESKFLARVFQNVKVTAEDCGTQRTLDITFRPDNASDYVYRNFVSDDGVRPLTIEDSKSLIGSVVKIRSPAFCETQNGYCFTCMGQMFKTLDQRGLATAATAIGAQMSNSALKKMHGSSLSTIEIKSLKEYVV